MIVNLFKNIFTKNDKIDSNANIDNNLKNVNKKIKKEIIKIYDEYGEEVFLKREEWIKKLLKPAIEDNINDIESLSEIILDAYKNDVFEEINDTVHSFYDVDRNEERATNILGVFYANTGKEKKAKDLYKKFINSNKTSEIIYYNLGIIYEKEEKAQEAYKLFLKSLEINPNFQNSLIKALKYAKSKSDEEYYKILYRLSTMKNSWRAKLLKANYEIKLGNIKVAESDIDIALKESKFIPDAFIAALAILGNSKMYKKISTDILPKFNPKIHGPNATLNVLKFYQLQYMYDEGLELLYEVSKYSWNNYINRFIKYEEIFFDMKYNIEFQNLEEKKVFFSNAPIWTNNFHNPTWILNNRKRSDITILILPFTSIGNNNYFADNFANSFSLFLNEKFYFDTDFSYQLATMYDKKGIYTPVEKYTLDYINSIKMNNPAINYIVSGNITKIFSRNSGQVIEFELFTYDYYNQEKVILLECEVNSETLLTVFPESINSINNFFKRIIGENQYTQEDINYILMSPKRLKLFTNLDMQNKYRAWSFTRLIFEHLNFINSKKSDYNLIEFVSLLYSLNLYLPNVVLKFKDYIYDIIDNGSFSSNIGQKLIPVIYKIYEDEDNFENLYTKLISEDEEYINWLKNFFNKTTM